MESNRYTYKDRYYVVINQVNMKHPTTRLWITAILYRPEGIPGKFYVREFKEFIEKFKKV